MVACQYSSSSQHSTFVSGCDVFIICSVRRFPASTTKWSTGVNSIAVAATMLLETDIVSFFVDVSANPV